jgi:hypothetical protein
MKIKDLKKGIEIQNIHSKDIYTVHCTYLNLVFMANKSGFIITMDFDMICLNFKIV